MKKKYESDSGFDRIVKAAFPPPTFVCEHCGSAIQGVPEQHFSKCESAPCNKTKLGTKRKNDYGQSLFDVENLNKDWADFNG